MATIETSVLTNMNELLAIERARSRDEQSEREHARRADLEALEASRRTESARQAEAKLADERRRENERTERELRMHALEARLAIERDERLAKIDAESRLALERIAGQRESMRIADARARWRRALLLGCVLAAPLVLLAHLVAREGRRAEDLVARVQMLAQDAPLRVARHAVPTPSEANDTENARATPTATTPPPTAPPRVSTRTTARNTTRRPAGVPSVARARPGAPTDRDCRGPLGPLCRRR